MTGVGQFWSHDSSYLYIFQVLFYLGYCWWFCYLFYAYWFVFINMMWHFGMIWPFVINLMIQGCHLVLIQCWILFYAELKCSVIFLQVLCLSFVMSHKGRASVWLPSKTARSGYCMYKSSTFCHNYIEWIADCCIFVGFCTQVCKEGQQIGFIRLT